MINADIETSKGKTMLCPSCKNVRPANNEPCPFCYAPTSLIGAARGDQNASFTSNQGQVGFAGVWKNPAEANTDWNAPSASAEDLSVSAVQRLSFSPSNTQPAGQSLQPAPYQGQQAPTSQALIVMPTGFPTIDPGIQPINPLLPAFPDDDQEAPVFLPPMYTKPRPLISRYRAISGLLSVLVIFSLLCSGAGYYAQVTGKLTFFEKLIGIYSPPPIPTKVQLLPVPSLQAIPGTPAAYNSIYSAAISNKKNIDLNNYTIANEVNQFIVGDTIYLICNFASSQGIVTVKWYTSNNLYRTVVTDATKNGAYFFISYGQATEGKVEIYWNSQLARTLLFVVEPAA